MEMRADTKAKAIPQIVKREVAERDSFDGHPCCIICGCPAPISRPTAFSCAHFISRAHGGLGGVKENIVTLCPRCHMMYDQGIDRKTMEKYLEEYLKSKHPEWDREKLIYRR
jgi:5-methylcytosine-specific restriction endonuclease McrA